MPDVTFIRFNYVRVVVQFTIERGMHAGEMVALEVVVDIGFPVALHLIRTPLE